jgi:hypothetical protein
VPESVLAAPAAVTRLAPPLPPLPRNASRRPLTRLGAGCTPNRVRPRTGQALACTEGRQINRGSSASIADHSDAYPSRTPPHVESAKPPIAVSERALACSPVAVSPRSCHETIVDVSPNRTLLTYTFAWSKDANFGSTVRVCAGVRNSLMQIKGDRETTPGGPSSPPPSGPLHRRQPRRLDHRRHTREPMSIPAAPPAIAGASAGSPTPAQQAPSARRRSRPRHPLDEPFRSSVKGAMLQDLGSPPRGTAAALRVTPDSASVGGHARLGKWRDDRVGRPLPFQRSRRAHQNRSFTTLDKV